MRDTDVIFTCQADFADLCLNELLREEPEARLLRWLAPGVGLLRAPGAFPAFSHRLQAARGRGERRLLFLRHIFPLECSFSLAEGGIEAGGEAYAYLAECARRMDRARPFSVQVRCLDSGETGLDLHAVQYFFVDRLLEKGFCCDGARPETVISAVVRDATVYLGLSQAADNLSSWPGGMRRFARREDQISRAEFKLLEAMEAFSLSFPPQGRALDLGAAPGGWTKVLLEQGLRVTAVDPAALDSRLAEEPRVEHFRGLAQDFPRVGQPAFDLLVNDMRMEPAESAEIVCGLADCLSPDGLVVMTFKLPAKKRTEAIRRGFAALEKRFRVEYARQLFHNRSEITVVCTKRS
ncbi:MAG TPA: methyltransferase domain-containing protein [Firmicutes bacterium]|nr:methyltransferase domain-containing protein [Bacillota bacterium]